MGCGGLVPDENEIQTSVCAQIIHDHPVTNFCYNVDEKEGLGPGKRFGLCVLMLATNLGVAALLVGLEAEMGAFCKCIKGEKLETWPARCPKASTGKSCPSAHFRPWGVLGFLDGSAHLSGPAHF